MVAVIVFFFIACSALFSACPSRTESLSPTATGSISTLSDSFRTYWYSGVAEITTYRLNQARYGEIHPGTATLIFVTEPFSLSKQVKTDNPDAANPDHISVLKLNACARFITGIYPYATMLSVFQPVDVLQHPLALKSAASVQEWCGISYAQRNLRSGRYEEKSFSYFESEGDQNRIHESCWLEDALWTLIRINPEVAPVGRHRLLPGSIYHRLSHQPAQPQWANLRRELRNNDKVDYYIEYEQLRRSLVITYEKNFPHRIRGWVETYPGFDGRLLASVAVADQTLRTDYWNHHLPDDRALRKQLNLPEDWQ
ncbi:MAG: hypothetical protein RMK52_06730 [Chitinophagales bacterium]|nr:hypothetical protein [Chitinophagales bacterium]MDW8393923.1 hypothetical protein [Chitinophagales bacterium]